MFKEDEILRKDIFDFDFSNRGEVQIVYEQGHMVKTTIDWWSKYYYSIGDEQKAPGYKEFVLFFYRQISCLFLVLEWKNYLYFQIHWKK